MIGPAEIQDMLTDMRERESAASTDEPQPTSWPVFVEADHLDGAETLLIGSFARWLGALS